jgi:hypothetical protein
MKSYLNVYGPDNPGNSVVIVGNRAGLEALRASVHEALKSRRGTSDVVASDNIAYELKIYHGDPLKSKGNGAKFFWRLLCYPYKELVGPRGFISPWEWI